MLEQKIETLTAAVVALTAALQAQQSAPVAAPAPQPVPGTPQAVMPAPQPVAQAAPAPVAPAPTMPAPPSFMAAPAPQATALPFNDAKSLVGYVMQVYTELEAKAPGSGAGIQNVLGSLGVGNVNEVRPEQYQALYNALQALKG